MRKEEQEKIDKAMKKFNTFRIVVILALIGILVLLSLKNTNLGTDKNNDKDTQNHNEVVDNSSYYDKFISEYK